MYVLLSINKLRKLFLLNSSTTFFLMEMLTKTPKFWKLEILYIKNVNCPQRSRKNLSDRLSLWMGERPKCLLNEPTWSLYLLVVKVESSTVRDPHYLGVGRGGAGVHRAAPGDDGPSRGWHTHTLSKFTDTHTHTQQVYTMNTLGRPMGPAHLPSEPDSFTHEEPGKSPSLGNND